jgi:hypothetical protein
VTGFFKNKTIYIVQTALVTGCILLLYSKLSQEDFLQNLPQYSSHFAWWHLLVIVGLSAVNWYFDTLLWIMILGPFLRLPFLQALRFNLIAQSAGAITPLQAGDYGTRSLLLKTKIETRQNALLSLTYRLIKMTVRIVLGLLCLLYLSVSKDYILLGVMLSGVLLILSGMTIKGSLFWISKSKSAERFLENRTRINFKDLNIQSSFVPGLLLFLAYTLQTSLMIFWVDPSHHFENIWIWVVITYSITSFLPAAGFFDPAIKSAFATLFAEQFVVAPPIILFAFTVTWIVNLGIPGIISSLFLRRLAAANH